MFDLAKNPGLISTAASMLGLKPQVLLARVNEFETFIRNSAKLIYGRVESIDNRLIAIQAQQTHQFEILKSQAETLAALQTQHALFMTTISRMESLADGVTPAGESSSFSSSFEVDAFSASNSNAAHEVQTVGHLRGVYETHGNGD